MIHRSVIAVLIVAALAVSARGAAPPQVASSDDHLWYTVELGEGQVGLFHHPVSADGPYARKFIDLPEMPERMTAWGSSLWMVFRARSSDAAREVFAMRVRSDPATGRDVPDPPDRVLALTPLPSQRIIDFVGTRSGPVALVDDAEGNVRLLQLTADRRWEETPPPEIQPDDRAWVVPAGERGDEIIVLTRGRGDRLHERGADGEWRVTEMELGDLEIDRLFRMNGRPALIARQRGGLWQIAYLRAGAILPLAELGEEITAMSVVGVRDGARLLNRRGEQGIGVRSVDSISGQVTEEEAMTPPPIRAVELLRLPALLAFAVLAFVLMAVLRPREGDMPDLGDAALLAPMPRVMAALIDLAAAGLVVLVATKCAPEDLLSLPFAGEEVLGSRSFLLMTGLAILHMTISEIIFARTLGKLVLGARLLSLDGGRPRVGRVLLRNLVKALILFFPPLGVIMLTNPNVQGLDDLVGRTVVVRDPSAPSADGSEG